MRRDRLIINQAIGLQEVKEDLRRMLKENHTLQIRLLERASDYIYSEAVDLVPVRTGRLQDSIEVTVSKSPRYPGIIATATALNPETMFDYAYEQETNESYKHRNGGQAHFLEQPFRKYVKKIYRKLGWDK